MSTYTLLLIPAFILSLWAQFKVQGSYKKYLKVKCNLGMSGAEVADQILKRNGILDVRIVQISGTLTDHYHPTHKTVNLSRDIYHGRTLASVSIAAHEVGHAMQHAQAYYPLVIRATFVPVATICSKGAMPLFLIGMLISSIASFTSIGGNIMTLAAYLFGGVLLFHTITLPVEFNASRRAIAELSNGFITDETEKKGCKSMLTAAAMTYVAATLMALVQFLRFLAMARSRR